MGNISYSKTLKAGKSEVMKSVSSQDSVFEEKVFKKRFSFLKYFEKIDVNLYKEFKNQIVFKTVSNQKEFKDMLFKIKVDDNDSLMTMSKENSKRNLSQMDLKIERKLTISPVFSQSKR
jgi:hypothetical protein